MKALRNLLTENLRPNKFSIVSIVVYICYFLLLLSFFSCKESVKESGEDKINAQAQDTESQAKLRKLEAVGLYVYVGSRAFADELGRYPKNIKEINEAQLMLKRPFNYYLSREIPLDGSSQETGDIWIEHGQEEAIIIYIKGSEKTRRMHIMNLPQPSAISPRYEGEVSENLSLLRKYYSDKLHRTFYYQADIIRRAFKTSKAETLTEFRDSPFYPDLDYAKNLVTGEQLKEEKSAGNFILFEDDFGLFLAFYDEKGEILPNPEKTSDANATRNLELTREPILLLSKAGKGEV